MASNNVSTTRAAMTADRRRLLILLSVLLIAGFFATSLISYWVSKKALHTALSDRELPLTSDNIYSEIQRDLLRPIFTSSLMAHDTFVRDWVLRGEGSPDEMHRYLGEIMGRYSAFTSFFISDRTRRYYHPSGKKRFVRPDDPEDAWYFRVRGMEPDYEINIDRDKANKSALAVFINYRVFDYSGNFIGVTGVGLSVETVYRNIDNYQRQFQRNVIFADKKGRIILSGKPAVASSNVLADQPGLGGIAGDLLSGNPTTREYQLDGETFLVNARYIPELQWHLIVEQPEGPALAEARRTLLLNLLICSAISAIILAATRLTINRYQDRVDARTEELRLAKEQAEAATQLKDKFIALVSHNLRGPLANIKGYLSLARSEKTPDGRFKPEIGEWLLRSEQVTDELLEGIGRLLDTNRMQTGSIELSRSCFDLHALAGQALVKMGHHAAGKGISLVNYIAPATRITGDRVLLGEVLLNLVANAIKFTRQGGQVLILPLESGGFAVRDTGVGIDPALLPNLLRHEVLTSTRGTAGESGTGLGLPYCSDIVAAHGGRLHIETSPSGTTVSANIPQSRPLVIIAAPDPATMRILEDELNAAGGITVLKAMDDISFKKLLNENEPVMVLADCADPKLAALTTLDQWRAKGKGSSVIALTAAHSGAAFGAAAMTERDSALLAVAPDETLSLPLSRDDLRMCLRRYFP